MASSNTPPPPPPTFTIRPVFPMARFSIGEDEDGGAPSATTFKRPRYYSPPPSQSHTSPDEEDEDEELIPVEDVESDSQDEEELEEDEGEEEDDDEEQEESEEDEDEDEHVVVEEADEFDYSTLLSLGTSSAAVVNATAGTVTAVVPEAVVSQSVVVSNGNEELSGVFTDPDVLDCPICLDPLSTPVFQCENGHIACSSCCSKVNRKCPSCCMPIGYNRCRAIEKVIESVKVSCKNAQYGCTTRMIYNKKSEHEKICPHVPCFCPYPLCSFSGSPKNVYLHFGIHHAASTTRFTYDTTFTVRVERNQKQTFLQEQNESVIFILNHELKEKDHAFNVDCVGPISLKTSFGYQLTAKSLEATTSLHCVPEIYPKWSEHTLKKNYLRVFTDFPGWNGVVILNVCIKKAI